MRPFLIFQNGDKKLIFVNAKVWQENSLADLFTCDPDMTIEDYTKQHPTPPFIFYSSQDSILPFILERSECALKINKLSIVVEKWISIYPVQKEDIDKSFSCLLED